MGELVGRLEQQARSLPAFDSLIAAVALQGSFHLVTRLMQVSIKQLLIPSAIVQANVDRI